MKSQSCRVVTKMETPALSVHEKTVEALVNVVLEQNRQLLFIVARERQLPIEELLGKYMMSQTQAREFLRMQKKASV